MTSRRPAPPVATWLLKHLQYGRHKESLIGDLVQLHQEGRSSWWYWRQVLRSIVSGYVYAVRTRGAPLMIGLCAAWGAILIWRELNAALITNTGDLYRFLGEVMRSSETTLDARNGVLVSLWALGAILRILCFGVSGWIVARLNPNQQRVAVAAFAVSIFFWSMPWEQIRVIEAEVLWLIHYGSALIGILLGGLLASLRGSKRSPA